MAKTKESKVFLNHMYNELSITKEMIRQWTETAVERTVDRRLDVMFKFDDILPRMIDDAVREKSWSKVFWQDKKNLDEVLQAKIVKEITSKLLKDIGLDVRLVKKGTKNGKSSKMS